MSEQGGKGKTSRIELGMRLDEWFSRNPTMERQEQVNALQEVFGVSRATTYRYVAAQRRKQAAVP